MNHANEYQRKRPVGGLNADQGVITCGSKKG